MDEALAYVAEDSSEAAGRLLERVLEAGASLSTLGERGRRVPEKPHSSVRELLVDPFRLFYQARDAEIIVLAVLHQRQDFRRWAHQDFRRPDAP